MELPSLDPSFVFGTLQEYKGHFPNCNSKNKIRVSLFETGFKWLPRMLSYASFAREVPLQHRYLIAGWACWAKIAVVSSVGNLVAILTARIHVFEPESDSSIAPAATLPRYISRERAPMLPSKFLNLNIRFRTRHHKELSNKYIFPLEREQKSCGFLINEKMYSWR